MQGEKTAIIDGVIGWDGVTENLYKSLEEIGVDPKNIDYLIVNHMEPDHSGALKAIIQKYPEITLVGNKKTFAFVESFYLEPENTNVVFDDDVLDLGEHKLKFYETPMVHWPETMITYDGTSKILFSGDAFGSFGTLDGGIFDDELNLDFFEEEAMRYFTNIVGKYCPHTQRALKKLEPLDIKMIASTHGPVWRSNIDWIVSRYNKWSSYDTDTGVVIAYGSMYGHTKKMAEVVARRLAERGIKNIRIYDVSKTHVSYIISDIFKYKGFILGSPAYNNALFPGVDALIAAIEVITPKNHYLGIFGNYSWSDVALRSLNSFAEKIKWELVYEQVDELGALRSQKREQLIKLADAMADKLMSEAD